VDRHCPTCGSGSKPAARVVAAGRDYEYETCTNVFNFVACGACGTLYLSPGPARGDLGAIYPDDYYTRSEASGRGAGTLVRAAWGLVERRRAARLAVLLGAGRRRILDIGCGDGRLLRVLRRLGGADWVLEGIEYGLSDEAIRGAALAGIELRAGLHEEIDLGASRYDLIVAQQVIEHALDPGAMLTKIRRELVPGGHVVLDTPSCDGIDRALFGTRYWGGYHFPRHMTLFTPETLAVLARRCGLEVVLVKKLLSPVFWIMTLHNVGVGVGLPRRLTSRLTYRSLPLLALATAIELPNLALLGRTSNMRAVLRKAVDS
jgi:2-polyprenyl-3-methyl-5-hydroxy-6-metoxy-1,4-benzoquinol methylase